MKDHRKIIDKLYKLYEDNGFISEEEALDLFSFYNVSLKDIDNLTEKLLSMGVIFSDEEFSDDVTDKAKIDYESIYDEILFISPGAEPLVRYLRDTKPPQNNEWSNLIPQYKNGNNYASERLFDMYLRVVVRMALNYHHDGTIHLDDAIQEGALGLMRALERFDPTKHGNLASYIPLWIKQFVDRAIADKERTIRIPFHMIVIINKLESEMEKIYEKDNIERSTEELARIMGVPAEELETVRRYKQHAISFEALVKQELEGELIEKHFDDSPTPYDIAAREETFENIIRSLEDLQPKEKNILMHRMGFFDEEVKTLEEVGKIYDVTRERIRQIEMKALKKLKRKRKLIEKSIFI